MNIDQIAERILQATVIVNNEASAFSFDEFRKKVNYVLELNQEPLVLNTVSRRQLKNHLKARLTYVDLEPSFFDRLVTLMNRRIGGKRKRTRRKLK